MVNDKIIVPVNLKLRDSKENDISFSVRKLPEDGNRFKNAINHVQNCYDQYKQGRNGKERPALESMAMAALEIAEQFYKLQDTADNTTLRRKVEELVAEIDDCLKDE